MNPLNQDANINTDDTGVRISTSNINMGSIKLYDYIIFVVLLILFVIGVVVGFYSSFGSSISIDKEHEPSENVAEVVDQVADDSNASNSMITIRPSSVMHEPYGIVGGDDAHTVIDDATSNDSTDYIYASGFNGQFYYGLFGLPPSGLSDVVIDSIVVNAVFGDESLSIGGHAKIMIVENGVTTYDTNVVAVTKGYGWQRTTKEWTTRPSDGSAWTVSDVDNLNVGVALARDDGSGLVGCSQLYVNVYYHTESSTE